MVEQHRWDLGSSAAAMHSKGLPSKLRVHIMSGAAMTEDLAPDTQLALTDPCCPGGYQEASGQTPAHEHEGKRTLLSIIALEGCGKGQKRTWCHEHGGKVRGAGDDAHEACGHADVLDRSPCDGGDGLQCTL